MAKEGTSCVDCCGVSLTCASDDALECFNSALLEYVGVRQSALPHWTKALELDPSFVLTHCALVSIASCCRLSHAPQLCRCRPSYINHEATSHGFTLDSGSLIVTQLQAVLALTAIHSKATPSLHWSLLPCIILVSFSSVHFDLITQECCISNAEEVFMQVLGRGW